MLTLKYLLSKGEKVGLKQLGKILSTGMSELETDEEKMNFGLQAMGIYDRENDYDMEMYPFLRNGMDPKYYSNLIQRDDETLLKNIVWNPQVETPIHGHSCQG